MVILISSLIRTCLQTYGSLIEDLRGSVFAHEDANIDALWEDQLGRLRVWTANIGAHQTGQSSLDYRLRDASHIRQLIVKLLEDLSRTLKDVQNLIAEDDSLNSASDDSASDDSVVSFSHDPATELSGLYEELVGIVDGLYQMSVLVRKPARHDFLIDRDPENIAKFEPFDIQHTENKFKDADSKLINILGTAITQRRKLLNLRKRHRVKLGKGIEMIADGIDEAPSEISDTVATEFHSQDNIQHDLGSDAGLSQNMSQTTLSTSLGDGEGITIPTPPQDSSNGRPFECPYCFYIITINGRKAWRKHVMDDILPYNCIYPGCSFQSKPFVSRHAWYRHLQKLHKVWPTDLGDENSSATSKCPLCKELLVSSGNFERHVARHLQELALFALPRSDPDDEPGEIQDIPGTEVHSSSTDSLDERSFTGKSAGEITSSWKTQFKMVIHLPKGGSKTRIAKLDSGCAVNVVSKSVAEALGMKMEKYDGIEVAPLGGTMRPLGQLTLDWHVMGKERTYTTTFLVLDTENFDVLLGDETIKTLDFYTVTQAVF